MEKLDFYYVNTEKRKQQRKIDGYKERKESLSIMSSEMEMNRLSTKSMTTRFASEGKGHRTGMRVNRRELRKELYFFTRLESVIQCE